MVKFLKVITFLFFNSLLIYVWPLSPDFPNPPAESIQSTEPADVETPLRRGYYTNLSREEVISHYKNEFNNGFVIYTPRLNYPPEDAPAIIRDQTKSTFLEEIVHPLRESIYINGFEPKSEEYALIINGVRWDQKIIVRYVPSSIFVRVLIVILSSLSLYFLLKEYTRLKIK